MTSPRFHIVSLVGLLALGLIAGAGGIWYVRAASAKASAPRGGQKQLYRCPMHPQVVQEQEGSCPICGMRLVPVSAPSGEVQPSCPAPGNSGAGCCGGGAGSAPSK
jgi:hypothetical protein